MTSVEREKVKRELFKCFPEAYIKGLRGASSWHVGYMSQLAAEVPSYSFAVLFLYLYIMLIFVAVLTYLYPSFFSSLLAA